MPMRSSRDRQHREGNTIVVGLLEDDAACRQALAAAILKSPDMHLAWQATTLAEARSHIASPIDVVLVDLGLPDGSGLDFIAQVRGAQPGCAAMVSTMFGDDDHLLAAIQAGALGYLLKDVSADEMVEEIRSLHAGGSPINPMMARKLLHYRGRPPANGPATPSANAGETEGKAEFSLSQRETEVLQLVARGHILDEVAAQMGITRHTARSFVRRIYQKLQVNNRVEAVQKAIRHGLL